MKGLRKKKKKAVWPVHCLKHFSSSVSLHKVKVRVRISVRVRITSVL